MSQKLGFIRTTGGFQLPTLSSVNISNSLTVGDNFTVKSGASPLCVIDGSKLNETDSIFRVITPNNDTAFEILADGTAIYMTPPIEPITGNIKLDIPVDEEPGISGISINGNIHLSATHLTIFADNDIRKGIFLGDPIKNGTWRIAINELNDFVVQKRINGIWITRGCFI